MAPAQSRRDILKTLGLAGIGLSVANLPGFTLPALAQGETVVPFSDFPANFNPNPNATTRNYDIRKIDGPYTPPDQFFTTQHYGHPTVDAASWRLKVSGMVTSPLSLSLDDLKKMGNRELIAGFECSGNSPRLVQGFAGNGKWTGIPLRLVLDQAGVSRDAREFVFFGADTAGELPEADALPDFGAGAGPPNAFNENRTDCSLRCPVKCGSSPPPPPPEAGGGSSPPPNRSMAPRLGSRLAALTPPPAAGKPDASFTAFMIAGTFAMGSQSSIPSAHTYVSPLMTPVLYVSTSSASVIER